MAEGRPAPERPDCPYMYATLRTVAWLHSRAWDGHLESVLMSWPDGSGLVTVTLIRELERLLRKVRVSASVLDAVTKEIVSLTPVKAAGYAKNMDTAQRMGQPCIVCVLPGITQRSKSPIARNTPVLHRFC